MMESESNTKEPARILKLDEKVVNKIAAGEIIQRPANAVKELLENSLDAKSTLIQVTVKNGGLKMLQIQDNGTGIRKDDMDIVCERFTTSKLEKFEDLSTIVTFGFRGEALASLSHVSRLTIQTKTAGDVCAHVAQYENGKLKKHTKPRPCAGNNGTIITIEDLFFNMPQRRNCLKSANEEFKRIADVIKKYAIHNYKVGFVLKRNGESQFFRTPANSTPVDNVRITYDKLIAKQLNYIEMSDDDLQFKLSGYISNVNYSDGKGTMILFINHRLVVSSALKSAIDSVYNCYLPHNTHPFIYLSIEIEPTIVDVNIHPTKHEVHFLHEAEIIKKIYIFLETELLKNNDTRMFYKQKRLTEMANAGNKKLKDKSEFSGDEKLNGKGKINNEQPERINPKDFVRTDNKEQKIIKFFTSPTKTKLSGESSFTQLNESQNESSQPIKAKQTKLSSILTMRKKVQSESSSQLRRTFNEMTFVGVVNRQFALIQFETKLFMCDTLLLSKHLFYQMLLFNFENFKTLKFDPTLSVRELAEIGLGMKDGGWTPDDGPKDILAKRCSDILIEKSEMMREYFGLGITDDGMLETLPVLIENLHPSLCYLPLYILRLASEVDWETEEQCFESFCQETALFYSYVPTMDEGTKSHKWTVENVIYPAIKQHLLPKNKLKSNLYELANLPNLYQVFERC